jgi:hypothetical protein
VPRLLVVFASVPGFMDDVGNSIRNSQADKAAADARLRSDVLDNETSVRDFVGALTRAGSPGSVTKPIVEADWVDEVVRPAVEGGWFQSFRPAVTRRYLRSIDRGTIQGWGWDPPGPPDGVSPPSLGDVVILANGTLLDFGYANLGERELYFEHSWWSVPSIDPKTLAAARVEGGQLLTRIEPQVFRRFLVRAAARYLSP